MPVSFTVSGDPKGQPRPRAFARRIGDKYVARVFDAGTAEAWKTQVALAATPARPAEPFAGAVAMTISFVFRRPKSHYRTNGELKPTAPREFVSKPDADNLAKAVMDALTQLGGFWRDDSQITELRVWKSYGREPGAIVSIAEVAG